MSTYIKGLDEVLANLNKEILKIEGRTLQGLIEAAVIVRRDMDTTPPLIPISAHGGNLRGSYFSEAGRDEKGNPKVTLGFTASYAWVVHERIGKKINWNRPGSGPKFLEASLKRNADEIVDTIRKYAKIGG